MEDRIIAKVEENSSRVGEKETVQEMPVVKRITLTNTDWQNVQLELPEATSNWRLQNLGGVDVQYTFKEKGSVDSEGVGSYQTLRRGATEFPSVIPAFIKNALPVRFRLAIAGSVTIEVVYTTSKRPEIIAMVGRTGVPQIVVGETSGQMQRLEGYDYEGAVWRKLAVDSSGQLNIAVTVADTIVAKTSGEIAGISGQIVGVSGQIVGVSGQIVGVSGQIAGISGQIVGVSGQIAGVSGQVSYPASPVQAAILASGAFSWAISTAASTKRYLAVAPPATLDDDAAYVFDVFASGWTSSDLTMEVRRTAVVGSDVRNPLIASYNLVGSQSGASVLVNGPFAGNTTGQVVMYNNSVNSVACSTELSIYRV